MGREDPDVRALETPPARPWKAETAAGLLQDRLCLVGGAGREECAGRWAAARGGEGRVSLSAVGGAGGSVLWDSWRLSGSTTRGDRFCK